MYYSSRYLDICAGKDYGFGESESCPLFHIDAYMIRGNPKWSYKYCDQFTFKISIFKKLLSITFKWNHGERPMTEWEAEMWEKFNEIFKEIPE